MTIPIDICIALALLALGIGVLIGRCWRGPRPGWPRFAPDYSGLPEISGEAERYFMDGRR